MVRNEGKFVKSKNMNVQILHNQDLENSIGIGYTASKKIGNAVTVSYTHLTLPTNREV